MKFENTNHVSHFSHVLCSGLVRSSKNEGFLIPSGIQVASEMKKPLRSAQWIDHVAENMGSLNVGPLPTTLFSSSYPFIQLCLT